MLRVDGLQGRREERARGKLEHVVGAVAEDDLRHVDAVTPRQRRFQLEAVAVGIARDIGERRLHRLHRERTHAERILVRRQLDDVVRIEFQFAREFPDRLARLIRRDRAYVGGREFANILRARDRGDG